ncbi:MAG: hypothetical protein QG664_112 [Patescibacteria group bacterium]|nr:hypothetical protein [Patescibacteria group bacterium]
MIDIKGGEPGPAGALSNFCAYPFIFDGVCCAGAEGLIQSFKFDDPKVQREICGLVGREAKFRGRERDGAWKKTQKLWWQGQEYDRHSEAYQDVLDRLFDALSGNSDFRAALLASGDEELTHSIGKADPGETVLTEQEFCSRLMGLRSRLIR